MSSNENEDDANEIGDSLPATSEQAKDIKPISKDTVHRICSGQVNAHILPEFDGGVFHSQITY